MTYNLSEITFENDFYSISLSNGYTIRLNKIDEDFLTNTDDEVIINRISIEILDENDEFVATLTSVIGNSDSYITLNTAYTQYLGLILTEENMQYVTLEVKDE